MKVEGRAQLFRVKVFYDHDTRGSSDKQMNDWLEGNDTVIVGIDSCVSGGDYATHHLTVVYLCPYPST